MDSSNIYRIHNEIVLNNILYMNEQIERNRNEKDIILVQKDKNKIK